MPKYLDANGNPISTATTTYLDPNTGEPLKAPAPEAPAEKSLFQKAKDNFNAATQGAKPGDNPVKALVENIGQGGGQTIRAIAHPLNTLDAMGHMIAHPLDQAHAEVDALRADPNRFIGNAIGQVGTGAILGEVAAPAVDAVAQAAGKVGSRVLLRGETPAGAYESALKPSTTLSQSERAAIVKTGLDNAIPISKGGAEKVSTLIENLNQAIKDQISSDPTRPIDPNAVATRADVAKAKFAKQVNARGDLAAIDASKQQFLEEQGASSPTVGPQGPAPSMNAIDAQEMKQGTYRVLKGKFGEQGSASVEAQKALARGLKEEIASQFPELTKLNADESKLLDLQPVLERAVARVSNHQLIGIGTPIVSGAAQAVTGSASVGVVAGVLKSVLDNPYVKSRLAISLSKGAKIPYAKAAARIGAYSNALGSTSETPAN